MKTLRLIVAASACVLLAGCANFGTGSNATAPVVNGGSTQAMAQKEMLTSAQNAAIKKLPNVIFYRFNSVRLSPRDKSKIRENAEFMQKNSDVQILISGYTDPQGSAKYNHGLGQRRADGVAQYLLSQGVPASRICTTSYGKTNLAYTPEDFNGNAIRAYANDRRTMMHYGVNICDQLEQQQHAEQVQQAAPQQSKSVVQPNQSQPTTMGDNA